MALTEKYANFDLATGLDDGTSEANAWKSIATMVAGYAADDRVNIKRTASPIAGDVTLATSAGALTPIYFRGYTSTIADGGLFQSTGRWNITGKGIIVEGIDISYNGTNAAMVVNDAGHAVRCLIVNTNASGEGLEVVDASATLCYIKGGGATASYAAKVQRSSLTESFIDANGCPSGVQVTVSVVSNQVVGCVIDADTKIGIDADDSTGGRGLLLVQNSIYNASDGIRMESVGNGGIYPSMVSRNIIYSATNGIVLNTTTDNYGIGLIGNAMGSVTARLSGLGNQVEVAPVTLTADPFTNAAGQDFNLNDTAGGGATLRAENYDFNGLMSSYPFRQWVAAAFGGGSQTSNGYFA